MAEIFSVTVEEIIKQLNMEIIYAPENISSLVVTENDCNRPGLQLMGFYEYFNAERVQICGNMEFAYLASLDEKTRYERIDALFATKIPLFIVARGHELYPEMVEIAKKYGVPIARTQDSTTAFIAALIGYLNVELAPRITRHGVLIEVYGEGILIVGESGVGKSETAIELVKRGHRLVADDAVEIRKTSNRTLVGSSPDNIRHFLELRGIGIINTRRLFGMGAVKVSEKIVFFFFFFFFFLFVVLSDALGPLRRGPMAWERKKKKKNSTIKVKLSSSLTFTAPIPNRRLVLMIPIPLSSRK